jgi:hypothetical protein
MAGEGVDRTAFRPQDPAQPPGRGAEPVEPAELTRQVERAVDRLRSLGPARLAASTASGATVADEAHRLAQRLADLAADCEGRLRRPVPRLADTAVADQVAVTGADLLAALGAGPDGADAPADAALSARVREAVDSVRRLRRALP